MAFAHSGQARGYNASDVRLLTKYAIVQFDKKQNLAVSPGATQEDRFIAAARQVKAADPGVFVLMYINGLINFSAGRLSKLVTPDLLLHNSNGQPIKLVGNTVFDLSKPAMRALFVDDARYGMATGLFDGVFIDRADWAAGSGCAWPGGGCAAVAAGERQLLAELTGALGEGNLTLSKESNGSPMTDWQVANAAMTSDTFCSHYCHGCNSSVSPVSTWVVPGDAENCAADIATVANMSARGQLSQSHAMGPFSGPFAAESRAFAMAAFLVGAGNLTYFSYANWATDCWELDGTKWWPEYDCPLGEPTSPANTRVPGQRWKYQRTFASGTAVLVDLATREVNITWAGGCVSGAEGVQ